MPEQTAKLCITTNVNFKKNKTMKKVIKNIGIFMSSVALGTVIIVACNQNKTAEAQDNGKTATIQNNQIDLSDWSDPSKKAIDAMKAKYGEPDEMTPTMIVWYEKGPWKRTIIYKDEFDHNFPMPHKDVMEQFISYKVPVNKFSDLARFDGSVVCNRTVGEMSARCDKEDMNMLALNLANDVIKGKKDVKAARDFYANTVVAYMKGDKQPYTQKFQFEVKKEKQGDSDEISDNPGIKELMGSMK